MAKAYQILNWQRSFENERSRAVKRCAFVCLPNKMGMGLSKVLAHDDGAAIFGVFVLILEMCSRQQGPRDGWLTDDGTSTGRAYDPDDIAVAIRRSSREVTRTLDVLSSPKIGWLSLVDTECRDDAPTTFPRPTPDAPTTDPPEGRKEGTKEPPACAGEGGGDGDFVEIPSGCPPAEVGTTPPMTPPHLLPEYLRAVKDFGLGTTLGPANRAKLSAMLAVFGEPMVRDGLTEARANRATNAITYADAVCNRLYAEKFQGKRPARNGAAPRPSLERKVIHE